MTACTRARMPHPFSSRGELECPICLALLVAPAVTRCGHTFCTACIAVCARRAGATCPVCGIGLGGANVYPNATLARLAERARGGERAGVWAMTETEAERLLEELLKRKKTRGEEREKVGTAVAISFLETCLREKGEKLRKVTDELAILEEDLNVLKGKPSEADEENVMGPDVRTRNVLIARYRENVEDVYFRMRRGAGAGNESEEALKCIMDMLVDATSISSVKRRSSMEHIDIFQSNNNLISSIEFNATATLFASAGATRRIKLFKFDSLLQNDGDESSANQDLGMATSGVDACKTFLRTDPPARRRGLRQQHHYPLLEIPTASKLSCLSWSRACTSVLAASTYSGEVLLHDTDTNKQLLVLKEHTKRAWYVDFSSCDPNLLLSGSDDHTVKLWDVNRRSRSAMTLQAAANVCCVKFNPHQSHELVFGSADHNIYSYDLRRPATPLCVFEGHWRAVSHVLFLNRSELISASTDSSCKLWNMEKQEAGLSYAGHTNDRNFVGLSGWRDFFVCGSEDNSVYVYHKGFAGPVARYESGSRADFVSTVAWKPDSNLVVAANNNGGVEVLELN